MQLADAWPLFHLRIRSERLELRLPTDDELVELCRVARDDGVHDPGEMPFAVAWTDLPSPAFERNFLQYHWSARASFRPEDWMLNLVALLDGRPVGSQTLYARAFPALRTAGTGSWLARPVQGRGLGKEMRQAVLAFAFDHLDAEVAETEAFVENARSAGVSRAIGYADNGLRRAAPRGVAKEMRLFRMTRAAWRERPRPSIEVEGLDTCRDLFGAVAAASR